MSETDNEETKDGGRPSWPSGQGPGRAVGSPLPVGGRRRAPLAVEAEPQAVPRSPGPAQTPPQDPAQSHALPAPQGEATGFQWAINAIRAAMPLVQKIIPLLDGNVATTVSNLMTHTPHPPAPAPAVPTAQLARIEEGMAGLASAHHELQDQVAEQNESLHRVEDRNTLEQQELMEDLKTVGAKVNIVALVLLVLLVLSMLINVALYVHLRRVLP